MIEEMLSRCDHPFLFSRAIGVSVSVFFLIHLYIFKMVKCDLGKTWFLLLAVRTTT